MSKYALIVDDEPDALALMNLVVRVTGLETRTATHGFEALDHLRRAESEPPAVILLDLMMPVMDGFAVYTWLRGNPSIRQVPVIVTSSMSGYEINMQLLPGVRHIIQKGHVPVTGIRQLVQETVFGFSPNGAPLMA